MRQQIENQISFDKITCNNDKHILVERQNGKLACVYSDTAKKLNWINNMITTIQSGNVSSSLKHTTSSYSDKDIAASEDDLNVTEVRLFLEKYPQAEIIIEQVEYEIHKKYYRYTDEMTKDSINLVLTKHISTENTNSILSCHLDQYDKKTYGMIGSKNIIEYLQNYDCLSENSVGKLEPITIRESFLELGFDEDVITVFITDMTNRSSVSMELFAVSKKWTTIPISNLVEAHNKLPETSSDDQIMAGTVISETIKAGTYITQNDDKEFWYTIRGSEDQIITIELQGHEFDRITFVSDKNHDWIDQINEVVDSRK